MYELTSVKKCFIIKLKPLIGSTQDLIFVLMIVNALCTRNINN